jgi:hypothetical protein
MSNPQDRVELKVHGKRKEIEARRFGVKPSWKNYGDGSSRISLSVEHDGSLYIIASETAYGKGDRNTTKEVFVSLPTEGAKLLKQILNERTDI